MSVWFAARLREQPSFNHLFGRFCEATWMAGYGSVCLSEAVRNVVRQHGVTCRICNEHTNNPYFFNGFGKFTAFCSSCGPQYARFLKQKVQADTEKTAAIWLSWVIQRNPSWLYKPTPEAITERKIVMYRTVDRVLNRLAGKHRCKGFDPENCALCFNMEYNNKRERLFYKLTYFPDRRRVGPKWGRLPKVRVSRGGQKYYVRHRRWRAA